MLLPQDLASHKDKVAAKDFLGCNRDCIEPFWLPCRPMQPTLGHQLLRCGPWQQQGMRRSLQVPMAAPPKAEDIDFNRTNVTELETMNVTEIKKLCKMHGLSAVGEHSGNWRPCIPQLGGC